MRGGWVRRPSFRSSECIAVKLHSGAQAKFPLFSKVEVNGKDAHPLFSYLKAQFGIKTIPWNFQKVCDALWCVMPCGVPCHGPWSHA